MQVLAPLADPAKTLARPLVLGGLSLRNRIAMAPMTRECATDGVPTPEMADYYARRAEGGAGLIVTEGAAPNEEGRFGRDVPRLFGREAMAGWERVVRRVHAAGAAIFAQVWHVGAFVPSLIGMRDSLDARRFSPSGLAAPGRPLGEAMTAADIARTVRDFAESARAAREAGFDGIEIHAAHGYLPDQFFWAPTNWRQDGYGGDLAQRSRFAAELVGACKDRAGAGFPVVLRISQWKQLDYAARVAESPELLASWLAPLVRAGTDAFHVSTRRFWDPAFPGNETSLAAFVRRLSNRPVIAVGSLLMDIDFKAARGKLRAALAPATLQWAAEAIEQGDFDLVAAGRAHLSNPDLAARIMAGEVSALRSYDRRDLEVLQ
ncbi:MAG: 12-oxophytodienoate reductase [Rhodobacteraceae bacterium]|nr:12-oxophytodienoate reductase [Paracoccaceae bacterium]